MSSFTPPSLSVIIAVLAALLAGFLLGRMGRDRGDPGDFSRHRPAKPPAEPLRPAQVEFTPEFQGLATEMPPEVIRHLQEGRLIKAIKALRETRPDLGLKEAKDAVEAYVRRNRLH